MLNSSYKVKRDLLTKMSSIRNTDGGLVVQRNDTYDKLGRPLTRQTLRSGGAMNETFDDNDCSEIIHATRTVGDSFDYAYDNIGNRVTAQEVNSGTTSDIAYVTNDLNQYTQIDTNGNDFTPVYDKDGNQTLIQTETGIWRVTYNVQNRAVRFENESSGTVITCDYDYLGRRVFKKVEKNGVVTAHERYLYRGYLQIASLDMMEGQNQALINAYVWDPTQPVATRPLAIFYKGSAYYYGWDLTKNITEIFSLSARLQIDYVYTPFGQVRENGIIQQSIQWSSEYHDAETGLVYYNYRYYNPRDGRWTRRDPVGGVGTTKNLYWAWVGPMYIDILGLESLLNKGKNKLIEKGVGKLCKEVGEGKETGEVSKEVADIVKKGGTKTGKGTSNSSNKEDTGTRVEVTASVKIQEKEAAIRLKARADTHGNSSASASPSLHRNSQLSKREGRIGVSYYNGSSEVNVELFISKRAGEKIEAGISVGLKKSF